MRKIEQKMLQAIKDKTNFFQSNTQVIVDGGNIEVRLYGHSILRLSPTGLILSNAGYATNTTHSRLRALASLLPIPLTVKGKQGDTLFITSQDTFYNSIEMGDYHLCKQ